TGEYRRKPVKTFCLHFSRARRGLDAGFWCFFKNPWDSQGSPTTHQRFSFFGYSTGHNSPNSLVEHFTVLVCQDIPESYDAGPWNIGLCGTRFIREMSGSFTDGYELSLQACEMSHRNPWSLDGINDLVVCKNLTTAIRVG
ncbi:MAG: hypothetical protein R6U25_07400, partial [Alkalispirochaeta sp.]